VAATRDDLVFGLIPQQARRRWRPPHDQFLDEPNRVGRHQIGSRQTARCIALIVRNAGGGYNAGGARGARREGECDA
jgi:hypothetical protein